jgi:hypothetical protein
VMTNPDRGAQLPKLFYATGKSYSWKIATRFNEKITVEHHQNAALNHGL